jgi:hypothetical protein
MAKGAELVLLNLAGVEPDEILPTYFRRRVDRPNARR